MFKKLRFLFIMLLLSITFIGCDFFGNSTTITDTAGTNTTEITTVVTTRQSTTTEELLMVTFDSVGGTSVEPVYVSKGSNLPIPSSSRNGYTLEGWYTSLNNGVTLDEKWSFMTSLVNNDVILYAKWILNQYAITYTLNGGGEVSNALNYSVESSKITLNSPSKSGYSFAGWYDNSQFNGDTISNIEMGSFGNLDLYAKWVIIQYTISFQTNGGSSTEDINQTAIMPIVVPNEPVKEGYEFVGWFLDQNFLHSYEFENYLENDTVVYAKWVENQTNILNWNIGSNPYSLDPTLNGGKDGGNIINNTFEGLVREVGGVVYPGIAESWETSQDGLTITFHLRQSVWSDGTPLTASDFVYSWLRGMNPATFSEYAWIWEYTNIVGAVEAVFEGASLNNVEIEATDDYTLEVHLTCPTPYFVSLMSFYHFMPVKQSAVEAIGGEEGLWAKNPMLFVSNGPFKLTSYISGTGLTLEKNDLYWSEDTVYLSRINAFFISQSTTAYVAYVGGSLDVLPSVPNAMVSALIAEDPEFWVYPLLGTYYYNFNLEDEDGTWDNLNLRKALNYAIDRTAITEALSGGEIPSTGYISSGFLDNEGNDFAEVCGDFGMPIDDSKYAEAVALFVTAASEMGMTVSELQTLLSTKDILYNTSESHKLVAEMVQESWNQVLGINVTLLNRDWAVFQDTRQDGNYDIARGGWVTDFMDPFGMLTIFTSDNPYNDSGYDSAAFDALMIDAQTITDVATHFQKLYAAQDILMVDLPIIPIYYYADTYLIKNYVSGWGRSVLGSLDFTHARILD